MIRIQSKIFFIVSLVVIATTQPCSGIQYNNTTINLQKQNRPRATVSLYTSIKTNIKRESREPGSVIRIGDIASVFSQDKQLAAKIESLDIDTWPKPGNKFSITRSQLQIRTQIAGYSVSDVVVSGNARVKIIGVGEKQIPDSAAFESNPFTQQLLQNVIASAAKRYGVDEEAITVEVLGAPILPAELDIAASELTIDVISDGSQLIGKQTVELLVSNGRLTRQVKLPLSILIAKEVAVTSSIVRTGDVLSKANVRLQKMHFTSGNIDDSVTIDAFGSFSTKNIRRNQMLKFSDLGSVAGANRDGNRQIVVKRGDLVTAKYRRNSIELNLAGVKTLQAGKIGQLIQVERQDNGRTFAGRVISATEIEIR